MKRATPQTLEPPPAAVPRRRHGVRVDRRGTADAIADSYVRDHATREARPEVRSTSCHETWRCQRTNEYCRPSRSIDGASCDQCGRTRAGCEGAVAHGPARPGEAA